MRQAGFMLFDAWRKADRVTRDLPGRCSVQDKAGASVSEKLRDRVKTGKLSGASVVCGLLLAGCAVGPDYKKPQSWAPPEWKKGASSVGLAGSVTTTDLPDPAWWDIFHDATLSALERRLSTENLDVQQAAARMAQSRGELAIAGAELYPGLSAPGSYPTSQYRTKMIQRIVTDADKKHPEDASPGLGTAAAPRHGDVPALHSWAHRLGASC